MAGKGNLELPLEAGVPTPHAWGSQMENHHITGNGHRTGEGPALMAHADCR